MNVKFEGMKVFSDPQPALLRGDGGPPVPAALLPVHEKGCGHWYSFSFCCYRFLQNATFAGHGKPKGRSGRAVRLWGTQPHPPCTPMPALPSEVETLAGAGVSHETEWKGGCSNTLPVSYVCLQCVEFSLFIMRRAGTAQGTSPC